MRAVIIPNDPLSAYVKKGEMIERYFNPENIFDRIDIVSLADSDVEPASVQHLAGKARLNIQPAGRISLLRALFPGTYVRRITRAVDVMGADVIIAHNSNVAGFVAARLGKIFRIPVVICMHTNPDKDIRAHISWKDIKRKLFWLYSSVFLENYALKYSAKVVCAYNFITGYLISRGVGPGRIKVIYHRIDVEKFRRRYDLTGPKSNEKLRILCVGRVFERKNPENIIRAIKNLNVHLTIIGDGNLLPGLIKLSGEIGVFDRVDFVKAVPHEYIYKYYKNAHAFACVNDYGGVSKPVMEAMAAALPVIMKRPLWEKMPEFIEDAAILTEDSALGFESAFRYLLENPEKIDELGKIGFYKIKTVEGSIVEKEEAETILSTIRGRS